jgi:transcriptional regulator with XRE-family HTH domain
MSGIKKACDLFSSQRKFAKEIGVSQCMVSKWLSGKCEPTLKNARKIVAISNGGITYDDIFKSVQQPTAK